MNIVFNITAYMFFILLFIKIIIHIYLDNSNGYKIVVSPVSTWIYLLPYDKEVLKGYEKKKKLCNKVQRLLIYFLWFTILSLGIKAFAS